MARRKRGYFDRMADESVYNNLLRSTRLQVLRLEKYLELNPNDDLAEKMLASHSEMLAGLKKGNVNRSRLASSMHGVKLPDVEVLGTHSEESSRALRAKAKGSTKGSIKSSITAKNNTDRTGKVRNKSLSKAKKYMGKTDKPRGKSCSSNLGASGMPAQEIFKLFNWAVYNYEKTLSEEIRKDMLRVVRSGISELKCKERMGEPRASEILRKISRLVAASGIHDKPVIFRATDSGSRIEKVAYSRSSRAPVVPIKGGRQHKERLSVRLR